MRNLKRVLALALAVIMMIGMMVTASAASSADFTDAADISADYAEAVEVLTGMGIFKGDDKGALNPKQILTREQAAALIYRVISGDVKDAKIDLYDFSSLDDVVEGYWSTGYITYCVNGQYINGWDNKFHPQNEMTGVMVLAILQRALGYGKAGEYVGAAWMDNVLTDADKLGFTDGIKANDLEKGATREMIAQIIFNVLTEGKLVSYSPLLGYTTGRTAQTLGEKVFDLTKDDEITDIWGRPCTVWFADKGDDGIYNVGATGKKAETVYAVIEEAPVATYTVKTSECDIAEDLGVSKKSKTVDVTFFFDGKEVDKTISTSSVRPTLGGQGTLIEVYDEDHVVVISTYLAKVDSVITEKTDKNGHVTRDAENGVTVYAPTGLVTDTAIDGNDYAVNDYILVNYNEVEKELFAVQEAESFDGIQSYIKWNSGKRTIDKEDYDEAENFIMGYNLGDDIKYTWYKDQYGNIIGAAELRAKYAVLKDIIWNVGRPGYAEATLVFMNGDEEVVTVSEFDEVTTTTPAWGSDVNNAPKLDDTSVEFPGVSEDSKYNNFYRGWALYEIDYLTNGTVDLNKASIKVADDVTLDTQARQFKVGETTYYMTTKTEILVREGKGTAASPYTYTPCTIAELAQYEMTTADIFFTYKTVGDNKIADQIYVMNAVKEADFGAHLFVTGTSYARKLLNNTYLMTVLVDGVEREIVTNKDIAEILAANKGKLFHVTWDKTPTNVAYGHVTGVELINDASDMESDCEATAKKTDSCDYLAQTTYVDGDTIICNSVAYTIDTNTKFVGVDDYAEFVAAVREGEVGVWVIGATKGRVTYADTIYVGTELSKSVALAVDAAYGTPDTALADATADSETTWTFNMPKGNNADVTLTYTAAKGAVIEIDEDAIVNHLAATKGEAKTGGTNYENTVKVHAEDGLATGEYTVKVVYTAKSNVATLAYANVDGTRFDTLTGNAVAAGATVKYLDANKAFTLTAVATDADATVKIASGETLNAAVAALAAGNTVNVTESTAINGGYVVVEITAEDGATKMYYVFCAAAKPGSAPALPGTQSVVIKDAVDGKVTFNAFEDNADRKVYISIEDGASVPTNGTGYVTLHISTADTGVTDGVDNPDATGVNWSVTYTVNGTQFTTNQFGATETSGTQTIAVVGGTSTIELVIEFVSLNI